jgi:hypothetical protein
MRSVQYSTWEERQTLCQAAEAAGEQMLQDEIRNQVPTLVFDWPPPDPPPPVLTEGQIRRARIAELLENARSDWTTAQFRELLQATAQEIIG